MQEAREQHAFACGMRLALAMAAQGAEEKARKIADRQMQESLHVICEAKEKVED